MLLVNGKFIGEERLRCVLGLEKRQGMFADPEIPVRMADPCDIEIILKPKRQVQIGPANEFVENYPIINPLDPHFASIAIIK